MSCEEAQELTTAILVNRDSSHSLSLEDWLTDSSSTSYIADLDPDDVVMVFTTSGTTGYSKLVGRSHRWLFGLFEKVGADDVHYELEKQLEGATFCDRPMGWLGGYPGSTLVQGQRRVVLDRMSAAGELVNVPRLVWRVIQTEQCHMTSFLASEFYHVLDHVTSSYDVIDRAEWVMMGSQPVTRRLVSDLLKLFKFVFVGYGSTEAGFLALRVVTDAEDFPDYCCGKPVYPDTVRVVNADLQDCTPGEVGTVWARGDGVIQGYFNLLEEGDSSYTLRRPSVSFLPGGWFNTEDSGYWDHEGQIYVIGRHSDVITHGGHVVYPGWLERKLTGHPGVKAAVVVPVSDPVLHHELCACVQPLKGCRLSEESLREFAETMFLSTTTDDGDAAPKPKFYIVLEELPQTVNGKVDRADLKKMAEDRFGSTQR